MQGVGACCATGSNSPKEPFIIAAMNFAGRLANGEAWLE
jgi:hypothetical protein